jgi:hypothetical protein
MSGISLPTLPYYVHWIIVIKWKSHDKRKKKKRKKNSRKKEKKIRNI